MEDDIKLHLIYKITNLVNKKIYIGKTKEYYGDKNLAQKVD